MKRAMVLFLIAFSLVPAATTALPLTPACLWSQSVGGAGYDGSWTVTTDASGNVIIAGGFSDTMDLGGGPLVSAGQDDIFIAKYSPTGVHQWSKRFGDFADDHGFWVASDYAGNILLTGQFYGTVDFGGGDLVSAGSRDIFVAKFSPTGAHLWSQRFGGLGADEGHGIATDISGNVFVTGLFAQDVDFGGGVLAGNGLKAFLAKYDPDGAHVWSQQFGVGAFHAIGYAVTTDGTGNVIVGGSFNDTVDFGGGPLASAGGNDVFIAKYDYAGTHIWSRAQGGIGTDRCYSLATDENGDVFATGEFSQSADFGGGTLASAGLSDIFLAGYAPDGTHLWSQRFGSTDTDVGYSVATNGDGDVFVAGYFNGAADFGGGNLVSAGSRDVFVAKYSGAGGHEWSQRFGGPSLDQAQGLATNPGNDLLVAGYFNDTADFGDGPLVSAGFTDAFLARYSSATTEPAISSIVDIGNDQGRQVKVSFQRSGFDDVDAATRVLEYEVYRRSDAAPVDAGLSRVRTPLAEGWTYVGSAPAHTESAYSLDVPTIGDSTETLGQYYSVFFVRAATSEPGIFHDSPPDSGYSVDNLAPGIPGNLLFNGGLLSWNESPAEDFDYFTVYGANVDDFGSAAVVDYTVSPDMDVTASPYTYYFVTATDFSGNEGTPIRTNAPSGVGGTPAHFVLSVSNFPNPFNPRTTVSYTVPLRGNVSVMIYDGRGARVATLVNETRDAGAYHVEWDGRTDGGSAVASGVYFARIEQAGAMKAKKMVLLK